MTQLSEYRRTLILVVLMSLIILIDQCSKHFVLSHVVYNASYVIAPFLSFTLVFNKGISFGILNNQGQQQYILISVAVIVVIMLLLVTRKNKKLYVAVACIISGTIGNIIDRICYGAVVDFIDLHLLDYHFPVFNIADISIFCGIMLVLYVEHLKKHRG